MKILKYLGRQPLIPFDMTREDFTDILLKPNEKNLPGNRIVAIE